MLKEVLIQMPIIYLVGNKIDLEEQRNVSEYKGEDFAEKQGFLFKEISIKKCTVEAINEIIQELAEKIYTDFGIIKTKEVMKYINF